MATVFTDITGEGDIDISSAGIPGFYRVRVTDFGAGHPISTDTILRFVDLGWIAPFEDIPEEIGQLGPGKCFHDLIWITYEFQAFDLREDYANSEGFSGIHYALKSGVVIDFCVV